MAAPYDLLLKGGTLVNHDGAGFRDVAVKDGRIVALGLIGESQADTVIDCTGLHILPGVIDTQVHFREPGADHKEDLESGSRAAVMGGVTGVFEMPNTDPQTTGGQALADKLKRATGRMHCDFAFYVGATGENIDRLGDLERLPGCAGIKVFMGSSTGQLLVEDDDAVERVLRAVSRRAAFHSEDEARLRERSGERRGGDPSSHPVWRDAEAARLCTERLLRIARKTASRIHVLHVSTAEEMDMLARNKDIASVEVTPQHLTLSAPEAYRLLGTRAQMNPPIRDERHRQALWSGVHDGIADILGSDHAPHTAEEKAAAYPDSPSGMTGVQTLVPVMLDHVHHGRLTLARFVDMTSAGPARLFQIAGKGRIAAGYDADFTIVDLRRTQTITDEWIASKSRWTPYAGMQVTGWPMGTIVRGRVVMWEGELVTPSTGRAIAFQDTLQPRD